MPLRDHFRPPLSLERNWLWFHEVWATVIAEALNEHGLPEGYFAEDRLQPTTAEITYVSVDDDVNPTSSRKHFSVPLRLLTTLEVRVFSTQGGPQPCAAIMFVSPSNKGIDAERRAFVCKAFSYLSQNVSVAIIDMVTMERGSVHSDLMELLSESAKARSQQDDHLYVAAYNSCWPASDELDIMVEHLSVGEKLPSLPLRISELALPEIAILDLDATYEKTCEKRRFSRT